MTQPPLLTSDLAVFLDFDGTLAGFVDDPDIVALPEGGAGRLKELTHHVGGALAVISGRSIEDLAKRIPASLHRLGGHGADHAIPHAPLPDVRSAPDKLVMQIEKAIADIKGVRLEDKGAVLAVHYRTAPERGGYLQEIISEIIDGFDDYTMQSGKMVIEAKPHFAHKGRSLKTCMGHPHFIGRLPVMVGDDATDEDAMAAAQSLGGWAVKVGDGPTCADFRLNTPQEVWEWLTQSVMNRT